jgi:autotransporter-associated beta strand protein
MPIRTIVLLIATLLLPGFAMTARAQFVHNVADEAQLTLAIVELNPGDSIVFTAGITLTADLPPIEQDVTIVGNGFTLSGADQFRGLLIGGLDEQGIPLTVQVTVRDLTIARTVAMGELGGGSALGGAIFVTTQASVTLTGVTVVSSQAIGGDGGPDPGGDGLGGAIFVEGGGSVTVTGTLTINGNSVTAGAGAPAGTAYGAGLFLAGNGAVNFDLAPGVVATIADQIADETAFGLVDAGSWGIVQGGNGTLVLTGNNLYSGGTTLLGGTLRVGGASNVGSGAISLFGTSALSITGSSTFDQDLFIDDTPLIQVAAGQSVIWNGGIHNAQAGGQLQLGGGGTLSLTNTGNSYAGGTFVFGGSTLLVSADAALGDGAGGVTLGDAATSGTLAIASGSAMTTTRGMSLGAGGGIFDTQGTATVTLNGNVSGTGSLTKTGSGTLILGNSNSYTGATNMVGGILRAGSANAVSAGALTFQSGAQFDLDSFDQTVGSLSGNGQVALGSATLTTGGDNSSTSFVGPITGTGSLVKTGTGSLRLTGLNTYFGGTTVNGGSLIGDTESLQGNILDNTAVEFDQPGAGTYAGTISGTGALIKSGLGTLTLSGPNTYTGGTTVTSGILAGTTTSLQGDILNNAVVVFDQSFDGVFAGAMGGSGSLVKSGGGTLTLGVPLSHTGGTLISEGTLAGSASSLTGTIFNDASLVFTEDADGTFNGTLAGGGSVTKTGPGTLSLTGSHPMSGLFSVDQGTLSLAGSLGGSISVQSGARLLAPSPVSTVGMDAAALAASSGNRITGEPLMTIGGNLSLLPGSIFSLPVGLGPVPSVLVGGAAVIDQAELDIVPLDIGTQRTTSFVALTALNGLSMTGATASTQNPLLLPSLRQDSNSLFVTLINLGLPLATAASTGNAASVATAIDQFKVNASGDVGFIARELSALDDGALNDALRLVAGEVHASSLQVAIRDGESFTDMIRNELAARDRESQGAYFAQGQTVRWWSQIGGEHSSFDGAGGASGGTVKVGTGAGGFDWKPSDRWIIGGGAGFGLGSLSLDELPGSTDIKSPRAFGYAGFRPGGFGLKAGGSFARSKSKTDRRIAFAARLPEELGGGLLTDGVNREALSEEIALSSDQWSEYDDDTDVKTYRLEWFVGLRRAQFGRQGFTESGAGALSLLLPDQTFTLRQADVTVHLWRRERDVRPFFEALYRREMTSGRTTTRLEFADVPGSAFTIEGLPVPGHTFSGRTGVTLMTWLGAWTFEYQARYATGHFAHAGDVRVRFK